MLEQLDTFLAFGAVMLGMSLLITATTQLIASVFNARGRNLVNALERLVRHTVPDLAGESSAIAEAMARHPLIADAMVRADGWAKTLAPALRKDEAVRLLGSEWFWADAGRLYAGQVLASNDEGAARKALDGAAERWRQCWASARTAGVAAQENLVWDVLNIGGEETMKGHGKRLPLFFKAEATRDQVVKGVSDWFGSAMDRASQFFAYRTRKVTVVLAVGLALMARLDAFALLKQISTDPALRGRLEAQVESLTKENTLPAAPTADVDQRLKTLDEASLRLQSMGIQILPDPWHIPTPGELPGILTTIILLSLGAPFWFNLLRNMSNLRPAVANLEHKERKQTEKPEGKT